MEEEVPCSFVQFVLFTASDQQQEERIVFHRTTILEFGK